MLILDIFSRRAKTREAQLQVSSLNYNISATPSRAPCIVITSRWWYRRWFKTVVETKLETIAVGGPISKSRIGSCKDQRETQRKQRRKNAMPVVSLSGIQTQEVDI